MCDYSLHHVRTRDAKKDDHLATYRFGITLGFGDVSPLTRGPGDLSPTLEEPVAVCMRPGTEVAFDEPVKLYDGNVGEHTKTAVFRKINEDTLNVHHDALEFPGGEIVLLQKLREGQAARVLQLPAEAFPEKVEEQPKLLPAIQALEEEAARLLPAIETSAGVDHAANCCCVAYPVLDLPRVR